MDLESLMDFLAMEISSAKYWFQQTGIFGPLEGQA